MGAPCVVCVFSASVYQVSKVVIFDDNIQVGHDTRALISELLGVSARIMDLRRDTEKLVIHPGPTMPASLEQARLQDLCDPQRSLTELLDMSPKEPGRTLAMVQDMIDSGGQVTERLSANNGTFTPLESTIRIFSGRKPRLI